MDYKSNPDILIYDTPGRRAWQEEQKKVLLPIVQKLNNSDLIDETLSLAMGDDYDGCFTLGGEATYDLLREELERRLTACGFFEEGDEDA